MYIVREIFQLKFGHYREVKALLDDAGFNSLFEMTPGFKILTDFTGDSYRFIMEQSVENLAEFEKALHEELNKQEWQSWYEKFKQHVTSSHREILRQIR